MVAGAELNELSEIFFFLDLAGTFVFALTGALVAARKKHDIIAFAFFAVATGVGGGTIRDLLLDVPIFWFKQTAYIWTCLLASVLVWVFANHKFKFDILNWLDAIGLAAFSVVGASKALGIGVSPLIAVMMGVITCVFGGILRDVLANQENMLLRREIYISVALLGSGVFVILIKFGLNFWLCAIIAVLCAFILRAGAMVYGWKLPGFGKVD